MQKYTAPSKVKQQCLASNKKLPEIKKAGKYNPLQVEKN